MAQTTLEQPQTSEGTMFFHEDILKAYKMAQKYSGKNGRVATMHDVISAKADADAWSPIWTHYLTTTSGEFYGKSKGGVPIVVIAHGIDSILQDKEIMARSMSDLRECSLIQLTPQQFHRLEDGAYAPVQVVEHSTVVNMREYPTSVLSYGEACDEDPLLLARLGTDAEHLYKDSDALKFLRKHKDITMKESGNVYILTNDHKYPYRPVENTGGLLHIGQLMNCQRCGGEPSSVSSEIDVADLASAGRFIALKGQGKFGKVNEGLETLFRDFENNWQKFTVPNTKPETRDLYIVQQVGNTFFTEYKDEDDVMNTGVPQFHVPKIEKVGEERTFVTEILGYHGLFKYHLGEVRKMKPTDANAYSFGEPTIIWEDGNPVKHTAPIQFFNATIDTSRRIMRENEIKRNMSLVRRLLSSQ